MEHLQEAGKVAGINLAAFVISWSNVDNFFRTAGLIAACVYTCLKIVQLLKNWKKE